MALSSGNSEVGPCREPGASLLIVAGIVYVLWFVVF